MTHDFDEYFRDARFLAQGVSGSVYRAVLNVDFNGIPAGTLVAVKLIDASLRISNQIDLKKEIDTLKILGRDGHQCSQYVLCYYGYIALYKGQSLHDAIVTEYIPGIPLGDYIKENSGLEYDPVTMKNVIDYNVNDYMTDAQIGNTMRQLLLGLKYIHSHDVAHRDIKDDNIMYVPTTGTLKYIDFGLSCYRTNCRPSAEGTYFYMAPEIFRLGPMSYKYPGDGDKKNIEFFKKADIWSLGITFYKLIYGKIPLEELEYEQELFFANLGGPYFEHTFPFTQVSPVFINVIKGMIQYNPVNRKSIDELLSMLNFISSYSLAAMGFPAVTVTESRGNVVQYPGNYTSLAALGLL